ncbi:tyrosine-protein phosphatase [Sporosarcina sp. CAU 1771]
MIDMHSHLLFGVDDGSKTIDETSRLLEKAVEEGITNIIATPHAFSPQFHVPVDVIEKQMNLITECIRTEDYPITVHTGQEIRLHEHILESIISGEAIPLANSRYVLLELPSYSVPAYTSHVIQSILSLGKIPIVAHPERNYAIANNPELLERLVQQGALAQITAGSIVGHFGKGIQKLSLRLIESNLIHAYGSDVHNLNTRPFMFNKGLDYLEKKKHYEIVNILLENNERIIKDKLIIMLEPETPITKKWWRLIG